MGEKRNKDKGMMEKTRDKRIKEQGERIKTGRREGKVFKGELISLSLLHQNL